METLVLIAAVVAGLYFWTNNRTVNTSQLGRAMARDRSFAFSILRRELANYLVRREPDRFLQLYQEAASAEADIAEASKRTQQVQLNVLAEKYPFFDDLDFIGVRGHVLYEDELDHRDKEEIEEHYLDLVKFQALERALNPGHHWPEATSPQDWEHLKTYTKRIKDTRFRQRLVAAIDEFYLHGCEDDPSDTPGAPIYDTPAIAIYKVYHFVENRYGVWLKDTNEFGLYGFFVHDDGKISTRYYRSDQTFKDEGLLDTLAVAQSI